MHDEHCGRPSFITDDLVELVQECIMENRRFTITELSSHFPQISRPLLHKTVTEHLLFRKLYARWVPKQLTSEHKAKCMESALTFLKWYHDDRTTCLVQWLARLTAIQEVLGLTPGYTLEIFLEVQGLERGPPSLVRPIGQLLDMRNSKIRLRKLKLRLRDSALLTTRPPVLPLAATASVSLGSSDLQCHGFYPIGYMSTLSHLKNI